MFVCLFDCFLLSAAYYWRIKLLKTVLNSFALFSQPS